jgi:hypothetical protein
MRTSNLHVAAFPSASVAGKEATQTAQRSHLP